MLHANGVNGAKQRLIKNLTGIAALTKWGIRAPDWFNSLKYRDMDIGANLPDWGCPTLYGLLVVQLNVGDYYFQVTFSKAITILNHNF